jgi:tRNA dimethylallyltransferase
MKRMDKLLVICGPTATGKTVLAASIAKRFNGELVSADSRQVYRGMDLVTGKERPNVPIWLYDVVDPDEDFSVNHWIKLAQHAIADIVKRRKLPIIVGGTGLYIRALLDPIETISIPPDRRLREKLSLMPVSKLQQMLKRGTMNESDWNNPRRLIRKIEISQSAVNLQKQSNPYDYLLIGLIAPRSCLDKCINDRREKRLNQGMEREINTLFARYNRNFPSMSAISLNEHAYARRQITWFKKMPSIHWFDISEPGYQDKVTTEIAKWYTISEYGCKN